MIFDCRHTLGMRFSVKHTFSIECSHILARGSSFFLIVQLIHRLCRLPSLFFSVAMPFLYFSSVMGNTSEESSSLIGDDLGHLGFVGISPRPLTSSWGAT